MKVGLNATCFNARPSGARQRFLGIHARLFALLPDFEFHVFGAADFHIGNLLPALPNVVHRSTPIPSEGRIGKLCRSIAFWRDTFRSESFDVFEGFNLPFYGPESARSFLTVHDVRQLRADSSLVERTAFRGALNRAISRTHRIITVSESMKAEISTDFPNARLHVVHNGVDPTDFTCASDAEADSFCDRYGLRRGFVLSVGHLERRKNFPALIQAVAKLNIDGFRARLVIVGNDSGSANEVTACIVQSGLRSEVKLLKGLSDREMAAAYLAASVFVFPSNYEGFGIPMLEAMAAGCPMVLNDIPVFREIAGPAALYADAQDCMAFSLAIRSVLSDDALRDKLRLAGSSRVVNYKFDLLAEQVKRLYLARP